MAAAAACPVTDPPCCWLADTSHTTACSRKPTLILAQRVGDELFGAMTPVPVAGYGQGSTPSERLSGLPGRMFSAECGPGPHPLGLQFTIFSFLFCDVALQLADSPGLVLGYRTVGTSRAR